MAIPGLDGYTSTTKKKKQNQNNTFTDPRVTQRQPQIQQTQKKQQGNTEPVVNNPNTTAGQKKIQWQTINPPKQSGKTHSTQPATPSYEKPKATVGNTVSSMPNPFDTKSLNQTMSKLTGQPVKTNPSSAAKPKPVNTVKKESDKFTVSKMPYQYGFNSKPQNNYSKPKNTVETVKQPKPYQSPRNEGVPTVEWKTLGQNNLSNKTFDKEKKADPVKNQTEKTVKEDASSNFISNYLKLWGRGRNIRGIPQIRKNAALSSNAKKEDVEYGKDFDRKMYDFQDLLISRIKGNGKKDYSSEATLRRIKNRTEKEYEFVDMIGKWLDAHSEEFGMPEDYYEEGETPVRLSIKDGGFYEDIVEQWFIQHYLEREYDPEKIKEIERLTREGSYRNGAEFEDMVLNAIEEKYHDTQTNPELVKVYEYAVKNGSIRDGKEIEKAEYQPLDPRIMQTTPNERVWQRATSYNNEEFLNDYHSMTKYPLPQIVERENRDGAVTRPSYFEERFYKKFDDKRKEIDTEVKTLEKELREIESNQRHSLGMNGEKMDDTIVRERLAGYKAIQSNMRAYEKMEQAFLKDDYIRLSKMSEDDILKLGNAELKEMFPNLSKPMELPEFMSIMQKSTGVVLELGKRITTDINNNIFVLSFKYGEGENDKITEIFDLVENVDDSGNIKYVLNHKFEDGVKVVDELFDKIVKSFDGIEISPRTIDKIQNISATAAKWIPANNAIGYIADIVTTAFIMYEDYETDGSFGDESGEVLMKMFFGWAGAAAGTILGAPSPVVGQIVIPLACEEIMRLLGNEIYYKTKNWETADADYTKYHERAK